MYDMADLNEQKEYEAALNEQRLEAGRKRNRLVDTEVSLRRPEPKFDTVDIVLLFLVAGFFDLLSLIPVVGMISGPIGVALMSAWGWFKGVRAWGAFTLTGLGEIIEFVNELPLCIAFAARLIIKDRLSNKFGVAPALVQKAIMK